MTEPIKQIVSFINTTYHQNINIDVDCLRDNAEICKIIISDIKDKSLSELYPEIAHEWDYERNRPSTPDLVSAHSGQKAYWICPFGHQYSSVIASRTGGGCGCPICSNAGNGVYREGNYIGLHSLAKEAPDIAKEFDASKNGITADQIAVASNKKMWWKCSTCGFEWQAKVNNRTSSLKTGCPNCSRIQNKAANSRRINSVKIKGSLYEHFPDLCKEWDYGKNNLKPDEVSSGSSLKVWWLCPLGHSDQAAINHRTSAKPTGCPYCANKKVLAGYNDLATTHAFLLKEWCYERNNIEPTEISARAHKEVWWKCPFCGLEYESSPDKRSKSGLGCVNCRRKRNHRSDD